MSGTLPPCPGCGDVPTWSIPKAGKLRLGCACHSIVFDITKAAQGDVDALKMATEQILREECAKLRAKLVPEAGVRQ